MLVKSTAPHDRYLKDAASCPVQHQRARCCPRRNTRRLIAPGLDELRVSLDAADAKTFLAVRGKNFFARIVRTCRSFTPATELGITAPRVSLWLTGLQETVDQLPAFVRLADTMAWRARSRRGAAGVVFAAPGVRRGGLRKARAESSLFEQVPRTRSRRQSTKRNEIAADLGIRLDASGATEPGSQPANARRSRSRGPPAAARGR